MPFAPGQVVLHRHFTGRGLAWAPWSGWSPTIVVDVYRGPATLKLVLRYSRHSVWWLFDPDGAFAAWYVNPEEPSVRWNDGAVAGVDTTDQDLDIWVRPDRTWEWKDDDELAEHLDFPDHHWVRDPEAAWTEGRRVIPLIEAGRYPFDGTWCDFRPDPSWTLPARVPPGWDRPWAVPS